VRISIENESGFCFGVNRAIRIAEEHLDRGEKVYCLGEIVHNEKEVNRLTSKGMVFIEREQLVDYHDIKVLIRAHGEPPYTYEIAEKNNIEIIDGTCPVVRSLQKRIRKIHEESGNLESRIYIYGKQGHPEVIGLNGQIGNEALVVRDPSEIEADTVARNAYLFSQTTMDTGGFERISAALREKYKAAHLEINNTICSHISHREPGLRKFSKDNDLIVFVAGKNSSNGRILFEICKSENPDSYFISEPGELRSSWFIGKESTGICGATSTPLWLLEEVAMKVKGFTEN